MKIPYSISFLFLIEKLHVWCFKFILAIISIANWFVMVRSDFFSVLLILRVHAKFAEFCQQQCESSCYKENTNQELIKEMVEVWFIPTKPVQLKDQSSEVNLEQEEE